MNMQPGIKTEVKTYIRGFEQTVQTTNLRPDPICSQSQKYSVNKAL